MKANELQVNSFLQVPNVQFVIPVYQRNYDWAHVQCGELFNDILSVTSENRGTHFIGSIVYVHEGTYSTSEVKELVIIDGQQRLTTINILYVALYRFAKDNGRPQDADRLYNMFLTNQYVQHESSKLKLKQADVNANAFKTILYGTEQQYQPFSNVIENFNYFKGKITADNFNAVLQGLARLIFVEISLERDKDDPQRIFESLNSTGLDLSQSDLIRNFILMDLPPKEQQRVYETIWNPIEENARDVAKQQSLVSDYIRDYLTLRNKKIPNKGKVYTEFKSLYPNKREEAYQQELENIKSLSAQYRKLVNPSVVADVGIRKELEYISRLEINVAYPFLLQVFEDEENGLLTKEGLVQLLRSIQSYVWRRFITGLPTNALNKVFMTLYAEVDTEDYCESVMRALLKKKGVAKFPTDEDIKTALKDRDLYNIQSKNRSYLFEMLENYNNREYVDTAHEGITIEHIFPQSPHEDWALQLPREEFVLFKEKYLNTIANLTLSGNNGALGNKPFAAKKAMNSNGGEQGYLYSRLWLNSYLKTIENWDMAAYEERLRIIGDRFLKIWAYPDVDMTTEDEPEEQSIFDAEAPTYKKLEYFIFEDTRVDAENVTQLYIYVITRLCEKNLPLLLEKQDILEIARDASDFRAPVQTINGWFVESNIDSKSKFGILKKLLVLFELEDALLIKYAQDDEGGVAPNRFTTRRNYWRQLLPQLTHTDLFRHVNPVKVNWLNAGAGIAGLAYTFTITKNFVRIELGIGTASKEKNKSYFKKLLDSKAAIEAAFGREMEWEELPNNKMSRIKVEQSGVNIYNPGDWPQMNDFIVSNIARFEDAFAPFIKKLK